jgi:hypothetical protein
MNRIRDCEKERKPYRKQSRRHDGAAWMSTDTDEYGLLLATTHTEKLPSVSCPSLSFQ